MDRYPQERNPKLPVAQTAATVPTPGLVGPWSPVPTNVEQALNQLVLETDHVVLAQLGPDVSGGGGGFGTSSWVPANYIGTYSVGAFTAIGNPEHVGGYIAQADEVIEQITISAWQGPTAASTVHVWVKPAGGVFADAVHPIAVALGATETYNTTPLALNQGDTVAFQLDAADPIWSVFGSGLTISGLRRRA